MKTKVVLTIGVLSGLMAFSPAATRADDEKKADKPARVEGFRAARNARLEAVSKELKLTDDQKEKLKPVLQEQAKKVRELRDNKDLSRQDRLAKFKEIRDGTEEKVKPILTPEQFQKWKELRSEGPRRRKQE